MNGTKAKSLLQNYLFRTNKLWLLCFIKNGCRASETSVAFILGRTATQRAPNVYSFKTVSNFIAAPSAEPIVNKVSRPNMVGVCELKPDDGAAYVIKPFALLVTTRELQILLTREVSHLLLVNTA